MDLVRQMAAAVHVHLHGIFGTLRLIPVKLRAGQIDDASMDLVRQMAAAVSVHGIVGTLLLIPAKLRAGHIDDAVDAQFDRRYGTNTGGRLRPETLDLPDSASKAYGTGHQAINPNVFHRALSLAAPLPSHATFIDAGSGRGRALLLASHYSFDRIIGVEHARDLHADAEQNIRIYFDQARRCYDVESICADAAQFRFPLTPLVILLFNPFIGPVMEQFARNLTISLALHPRPCTVIYRNPICADIWDALPAFAVKRDVTTNAAIYRYQPVVE